MYVVRIEYCTRLPIRRIKTFSLLLLSSHIPKGNETFPCVLVSEVTLVVWIVYEEREEGGGGGGGGGGYFHQDQHGTLNF